MRATYPGAPVLHFPFRRLAFCLDCEACFELGADDCPACGGDTWAPLARFLEPRSESTASRQESRGANLRGESAHRSDN